MLISHTDTVPLLSQTGSSNVSELKVCAGLYYLLLQLLFTQYNFQSAQYSTLLRDSTIPIDSRLQCTAQNCVKYCANDKRLDLATCPDNSPPPPQFRFGAVMVQNKLTARPEARQGLL